MTMQTHIEPRAASRAGHRHAAGRADRPSFITAFRDHPATVGETYPEHLFFAARLGATLIGAGLAALVHALIPALFETTASDRVAALHAAITERAGKKGGQASRGNNGR